MRTWADTPGTKAGLKIDRQRGRSRGEQKGGHKQATPLRQTDDHKRQLLNHLKTRVTKASKKPKPQKPKKKVEYVDPMRAAREDEAFQKYLRDIQTQVGGMRRWLDHFTLRPDVLEQGHAFIRAFDAFFDALTLPTLSPNAVSAMPVAKRHDTLLAMLEAAGTPAKTVREFVALCHPETAAASLQGMARGLDRRGAAHAIAAALTNHFDCWLSQSRMHARGGHTQMAPLVPKDERPRDANHKAVRLSRQLCHRLAIAAYKSPEILQKLVMQKLLVSHRCHKSNCFNPNHLLVEAHKQNMERKACEKARKCICGLSPKCLFDVGEWHEELKQHNEKVAEQQRMEQEQAREIRRWKKQAKRARTMMPRKKRTTGRRWLGRSEGGDGDITGT